MRRLAGVLAALFSALVLTASPASAHATLLSTDPANGSVLSEAPGEIRLTFDEPVRIESRALQLYDPDGTQLVVRTRTEGAEVVTDLPTTLGPGTFVVSWQVVADDGHPLSGSFVFSVGRPSATPPTLPPGRSPPASTKAVLGFVQAAGYVGLLLTAGLVWFTTRVLDRRDVRRQLRDLVLALGSLTVVAALVWVPSVAAYQASSPTKAAWQPDAWTWSRHPAELTEMTLIVVGILMAVGGFLAERRRLATVGGLVAVVGPAAFGHDRALGPSWLFIAADAAHLAAGAIWFGGLVGLLLVWRHLSREELTRTIQRFSTAAAVALGVVLVTGSLAAFRILDSFSALVDSSWGRVFLVKLALVALVIAVGRHNRSRLDEPHLRAVLSEVALLLVVLAVTGFLTNADPVPRPDADGQTGSSQTLRSGPFGTMPVGFTSLWTM